MVTTEQLMESNGVKVEYTFLTRSLSFKRNGEEFQQIDDETNKIHVDDMVGRLNSAPKTATITLN